jgi:DNA-directed RNA polymerase subunit M/transcription elongation factor TFIIS
MFGHRLGSQINSFCRGENSPQSKLESQEVSFKSDFCRIERCRFEKKGEFFYLDARKIANFRQSLMDCTFPRRILCFRSPTSRGLVSFSTTKLMAIKARCGNCSNPITVRDEFGGKKVKCPKCSTSMQIPMANSATAAVSRAAPVAAGTSGKRYNPLLDLLDEAGVESRPSGPCCDNCGAAMSPTAIICIECGFNMATRQKLETTVLISEDDRKNTSDMTDAERLLAKAEKDIAQTPVTSEGEDFGDDPADSTLVMFIAGGAALVLIAVGLFFILAMETILEFTGLSTPMISLIISCCMWAGCATWITIIAFRVAAPHGFGCLLSLGLYCPIFGFMQGKTLLIPAIMMIASVLIGLLSYAIWANSVDEFALNIGYFVDQGRMALASAGRY